MKNFIYLALSLSILFNFSSCTSSKMSIDKEDMLGKWYPDTKEIDHRIDIQKEKFVVEIKEKNYATESNTQFKVKGTIQIVEKTNEEKGTLFILLNKGKDITQHTAIIIQKTEIEGIRTVFSHKGKNNETSEEVKEKIMSANYNHINNELLFSEKYIKEIYPTLIRAENITKEDYISLIKYVRNFEEDIKAFPIEAENSYNFDKFLERLIRKKLYLLGYNPNTLFDSEANFIKKFEGDKEIEELNNVETEIKF
jgi:hypothetical protein